MAKLRKTKSRRPKSKKAEICAKITSLIIDYVSGALNPRTSRMFEQHLRICPDCVGFLNTYKKTIQLTRSLRYEDIPTKMVERVDRFLQRKIQKNSLLDVNALRHSGTSPICKFPASLFPSSASKQL